MVKILKPTSGHKGDTFRELVDAWGKLGLCEVVSDPSVKYVWVERKNYILLYDFPTLNTLSEPFEYGLFGNHVPEHDLISSWIFWGRMPITLHNYYLKGSLGWSERNIKSLFVGKVENEIQYRRRTRQDWAKAIELFEMPIYKDYNYTQDEYLNLLMRTKFGLCLPGYGYKCNREIEYLALGVVPIITPEVNLDYYDPLIENKHYLSVESPDEIKPLLDTISEEKWQEMSQFGRDWYLKNSSPKGSYNTTKNIIKNEFNIDLG